MRSISSVRVFGRIARAPGGITAATARSTAASRAGSTTRSMRSSSPIFPNSSCAVATSTKTTLESIPAVPRGMIPATRSVTSRSPASACTVSPARHRKRSASSALTNAPCAFTSTHGSAACGDTLPGDAAAARASPGSGRSRSTPSTRRISPENGSPGCAPTVSASSIVGLA